MGEKMICLEEMKDPTGAVAPTASPGGKLAKIGSSEPIFD